jgi:hypothetical protein
MGSECTPPRSVDQAGFASAERSVWRRTMFMTDDELFELTGYRQPKKQIAMLKKQGVPFNVNASGHPKVARAVIEGGRQATKKRETKD